MAFGIVFFVFFLMKMRVFVFSRFEMFLFFSRFEMFLFFSRFERWSLLWFVFVGASPMQGVLFVVYNYEEYRGGYAASPLYNTPAAKGDGSEKGRITR